jgi:hypothetical protein
MRTCNSGSAMLVEEPALRAARSPTGCGRGPVLIGRTPAIAPNARTAVIVRTRTGLLKGKQVIAKLQTGLLPHGTRDRAARAQLREPEITGRPLACVLLVGPGSLARDGLPHPAAAGVSEVVEASAAVEVAAVDAGRISG